VALAGCTSSSRLKKKKNIREFSFLGDLVLLKIFHYLVNFIRMEMK